MRERITIRKESAEQRPNKWKRKKSDSRTMMKFLYPLRIHKSDMINIWISAFVVCAPATYPSSFNWLLWIPFTYFCYLKIDIMLCVFSVKSNFAVYSFLIAIWKPHQKKKVNNKVYLFMQCTFVDITSPEEMNSYELPMMPIVNLAKMNKKFQHLPKTLPSAFSDIWFQLPLENVLICNLRAHGFKHIMGNCWMTVECCVHASISISWENVKNNKSIRQELFTLSHRKWIPSNLTLVLWSTSTSNDISL